MNYTVIENLIQQAEIPGGGTLRRTIYKNDRVEVVLLGLDGGQELPQHAEPVPLTMQIIGGEARVSLDGEEKELAAGSWLAMDARLPHAVYARTKVVLLLTLLR